MSIGNFYPETSTTYNTRDSGTVTIGDGVWIDRSTGGLDISEQYPEQWLSIDHTQTTMLNRLSVESFAPETIIALKDALGYGDVVVKCRHCGQWAAVKTACHFCGAPVDP